MEYTDCSRPSAMLALLNLPGIGQKSVISLCNHFKYLEEIKDASDEDLKGLLKLKPDAVDSIRNQDQWRKATQHAKINLEQAQKLGVDILSYKQDAYPALLRQIPDPPPVIFIKGNLPQSYKRVACVGTREPTFFGTQVTRRLVQVLVEGGYSIVSGLAVGVDTLSHEAALAGKGHTIAVLANGLDSIYPKQNSGLAQRILDAGGALMSEQPFGTNVTSYFLVQRDRLQSGLSVATFVMQTDIQGGTMHTVRFTLIQGRSVYAPIPPDQYRNEPKSQGLVALTECKGPEFATKVKADASYKSILLNNFLSRFTAQGIKNQDDYPSALKELGALVGSYDHDSDVSKPYQIPMQM